MSSLAERKHSLLSRSFSQLSAYSVLMLLERGVGFALLPVYTRALTPSMYGSMELLDLTTNVVGMVMACRITQALAYFYHGSENSNNKKRYVSTAIMTSLALGVVICAGMLAGAERLSEIVFGSSGQTGAFRLLALTLGLSFPLEGAIAAFRTAGIVRAFTTAGIARLALNAGAMLILVVQLHLGVTGWLWSGLLTNVVLGTIATAYAIRHWGALLDRRAAWAMFRYSLPLNVSAVGMFVIHFGDRWFLRRAVSLDAVGIYSLAYKIGMLIAYVQAPFSLFWSSQMFAVSTGSEGEKRHVNVATGTALVYGLATVALANIAYPLLQVWVGPAFRGAAGFVPIVAIAYMLRAEGEFFRSAFQLHGRTSFDAWITAAGTIVCLGLYILLIPIYGAAGALISTLVTFVVMLVLSIWKAQQVSPYAYEWKKLITIGVLTVVGALVPVVFKPASVAGSALSALFVTLAFCIGLHVFGIVKTNHLSRAWAAVTRQLSIRLGLRPTGAEEC